MVSDIQVVLVQQDFLEYYGYDFTGYSQASFKRRIERLYLSGKFSDFEEFRRRLRNDQQFFKEAVSEISVNVTEMFRDPEFYKVIREKVLPVLATYPHIRIWNAGCATGEEVYSLAILLKETGLLSRSLLYGTDINPRAIEIARKGVFAATHMQQYSKNYQETGGVNDFSSYYSSNYGMVKFRDYLTERIIFSTHNLVTDFSFNSFQLIFCRNVLIYFDRDLQSKVLQLFHSSLEQLGFLALGTKESLRFTGIEKAYKPVLERQKIWRKIS